MVFYEPNWAASSSSRMNESDSEDEEEYRHDTLTMGYKAWFRGDVINRGVDCDASEDTNDRKEVHTQEESNEEEDKRSESSEDQKDDESDSDEDLDVEHYDNFNYNKMNNNYWCLGACLQEADSSKLIPLRKLLEPVPPCVETVLKFLKVSKLQSLTLESIRLILDQEPKARTIHVVWSHYEQRWSYKSRYPVNQVPWLAHSGLKEKLPKTVTQRLAKLYKPAPRLDIVQPYEYFTYGKDCLWFRFVRCSSREEESREYFRAIRTAAEDLEAHVSHHPDQQIGTIKVTYCAQHARHMDVIPDMFRSVNGIKEVIMISHSHGSGTMAADDENRINSEINGGALIGHTHQGKYPFKVRLFSCRDDQKSEVLPDPELYVYRDEDYEVLDEEEDHNETRFDEEDLQVLREELATIGGS